MTFAKGSRSGLGIYPTGVITQNEEETIVLFETQHKSNQPHPALLSSFSLLS